MPICRILVRASELAAAEHNVPLRRNLVLLRRVHRLAQEIVHAVPRMLVPAHHVIPAQSVRVSVSQTEQHPRAVHRMLTPRGPVSDILVEPVAHRRELVHAYLPAAVLGCVVPPVIGTDFLISAVLDAMVVTAPAGDSDAHEGSFQRAELCESVLWTGVRQPGFGEKVKVASQCLRFRHRPTASEQALAGKPGAYAFVKSRSCLEYKVASVTVKMNSKTVVSWKKRYAFQGLCGVWQHGISSCDDPEHNFSYAIA